MDPFTDLTGSWIATLPENDNIYLFRASFGTSRPAAVAVPPPPGESATQAGHLVS